MLTVFWMLVIARRWLRGRCGGFSGGRTVGVTVADGQPDIRRWLPHGSRGAGANRFEWQYASMRAERYEHLICNFRIVDRDEMKIVATGDCGLRVIN